MANQLDLVRATSKQPLYERIDLHDFDPSLTGSIRVRVNPTRAVRKELTAAQQERERIEFALANNPDDAQRKGLLAEQEKVGKRFNAIVATLIPVSDTDDTPTSPEAFEEFLSGDEDDDPTLAQWILIQIWQRVYTHFLAPTKSANGSTVGQTP